MQHTHSITARTRPLSLALAWALAASPCAADVIAGTGQPGTSTIGQATATQLVHAPGGTGHALLLPYFSAQNGNATLIGITNTDAHGKAVQVRLRGGVNGDTLLQFMVLLAGRDAWTATLREGPGGTAEIFTADKTCTLPRLEPNVPQPLLTTRLNPALAAAHKVGQTREGYIEILNMADIPYRPNLGFIQPMQSQLYLSIAPDRGEPACHELTLHRALVDTNHQTQASAAAMGLAGPTGGLAGRWTIINVPQTTTFSGSMHALRAVDGGGADARANFVLFPPTATPYAGIAADVTADPLLRAQAYQGKSAAGQASSPATSGFQARHVDLPDLSTPYVVAPGPGAALAQAERLTAAMAARTLTNEYVTDSAIGAKTDWVFSMPARRYSVAVDYANPSGPNRLFSLVPASGPQFFHEGNTRSSDRHPGHWCASLARHRFSDRDAATRELPGLLTGQETTLALCGAASVLSFAEPGAPSVLGSALARTEASTFPFLGFATGWGMLELADRTSALGLPVVGSAFIKASNASASPGFSGTYGMSYEHTTAR